MSKLVGPFCSLLLCAVACAETLHVDSGQPRPMIELMPKHAVRLKLEMRKIADELTLQSDAGAIRVHGWRGTLAFGYVNGVRVSFPPVQGVPVLTIEVLDAT